MSISRCDVVVNGAGPVGLAYACLTKAMNKNLGIYVFDKREKSDKAYGLAIGSDSVAKIQGLLKFGETSSDPNVNKEAIKSLKALFSKWEKKAGTVSRSKIEEELGNIAKALGIEVRRGTEYEVIEESFDNLLAPEGEVKALSEQQELMRKRFSEARLVVAADGAHSPIRNKVMGGKLEHETTLQHVVELKFITKGTTERRNLKEGSIQTCEDTGFASETMSKQQSSEPKTGTYHIFVDQETYRRLRIINEQSQKVTKGNTANPWKLEELQVIGQTDKKIHKLLKDIKSYLRKLTEKRGGSHEDLKITTIPLSVFRSAEVAKIYKGKVFSLVGDASSGMIIRRGLTKGWIEAVLNVRATLDFFKRIPSVPAEADVKVASSEADVKETEAVLPKEFIDYQNATRKLFASEFFWAKLKTNTLKVLEFLLKYPLRPFVLLYLFLSKPFRKLSSLMRVNRF